MPIILPLMRTRAPSPPELPPGVTLLFAGFKVRPKTLFMLSRAPSVCGTFVLAMMMAPRDSNISTSGAFCSAGLKDRAAMPMLLSIDAILKVSFTEMGRPWRGPIGIPVRLSWASSSEARARARLNRGSVRHAVNW